MFTYRARLFRLFGFDVYLDASWALVAVLIVWSLTIGVFPAFAPGFSATTYLWMGVISAAGLFASIVLHEMAHSLVARRFGMPVRGITLFIFGGVAEMADEPTGPRGEFLMALAGPVFSVILGLLLLLAAGAADPAPTPAATVLSYLGAINLILAGFNMIPAFPLDGGRMLRAALWGWRKDIVRASRIASVAGEVFAILMIGAGVLQIMVGAFLGGLWLALIGLFLHGAAGASYRQVLAREALKGQPVSRFMNSSPVSAPADISVQAFVDDFVYRRRHRRFPVIEQGALAGCVDASEVAQLDHAQWAARKVREVMRPCREDEVAPPETDALQAMAKMQRSGGGPLFVAENGELVGVLSLRDLMEFLALRLELEGPRPDLLRAGPALDRPA